MRIVAAGNCTPEYLSTCSFILGSMGWTYEEPVAVRVLLQVLQLSIHEAEQHDHLRVLGRASSHGRGGWYSLRYVHAGREEGEGCGSWGSHYRGGEDRANGGDPGTGLAVRGAAWDERELDGRCSSLGTE